MRLFAKITHAKVKRQRSLFEHTRSCAIRSSRKILSAMVEIEELCKLQNWFELLGLRLRRCAQTNNTSLLRGSISQAAGSFYDPTFGPPGGTSVTSDTPFLHSNIS